MYKAIELISAYFKREFGEVSNEDFRDLSNVGLAYTEDDEGNEIQASVDLINPRFWVTKNGNLVEEVRYTSLEEMTMELLEWLDFDTLVSI